MKRSGFKPRITERGRAILAGTGPKIRLDIELEPAPVLLPPVKPRPRPIAPGSGLLAQAMRDNPSAPTERAIAALMKPARERNAGTYLGRVAGLGCVLCRLLGREPGPAEVHHIREGQGGAQRAPDFLTVPLCPACHRGPNGVHGDRALLRIAKVSELDLLAETISLLA